MRRFTRRALVAVAFASLLATPFGVSADAVEPTQAEDGCAGIANAYAHVTGNVASGASGGQAVGALERVAEKLGCDLSGVEPLTHDQRPGDEDELEPNGAERELDEDVDELDVEAQGAPGPDHPNWQAKCDKVGELLAAARERPNGKSAEAFERMAARWSCP